MMEQSSSSSVAGKARALVSWGCAGGRPGSTVANDAFSLASIGVPAFCAGGGTAGALSHTGTTAGANLKNRSLVGLCLGLDPDSPSGGTARPYLWDGPIARCVAKGVMVAKRYVGGTLTKVIDAGAGTDSVNAVAEDVLDGCSPHHGKVGAVRFVVKGTTLAAAPTDYSTLILWRRPAAGGVAVSVATADTQTAWTQFETVTFTLSVVAGALDKLETDIFTLTKTHAGNGAVVPAGKLVVDLEVH